MPHISFNIVLNTNFLLTKDARLHFRDNTVTATESVSLPKMFGFFELSELFDTNTFILFLKALQISLSMFRTLSVDFSGYK
jgi:hypothetical protein